jgi:hypothetical protein
MSRRLIIIPRWSGTPASDWYPWITAELASVGRVGGPPPYRDQPFDPVLVAAMPNPGLPTIPAWTGRVRDLLGDDPAELARTVIVGHSVGCQAVLRALAELPEGVHVAGALCVAGWFWTDSPWDSLLPWIDTPFDLARARQAASNRIGVIMSDNDPHTSDWRANTAAWQDKLGAEVVLVRGGQHFNGPRYPIILQTLLDHFGGQGETS